MAGKTVEGIHGPGVAIPGEIAHAGEDAERAGQGKAKLFEADSDFAGEDRAGRGSVDGDVRGLVGLEQLFIDSDDVVESGGEGMLGGEAIEDGDNFDFREVGDGDGFGPGAGVGVEAATMDIEEDAVGVHAGEGGDDADGNTGHGAFGPIHRIELRRDVACMVLPDVGSLAALFEGLRMGRVGNLAEITTFSLRG